MKLEVNLDSLERHEVYKSFEELLKIKMREEGKLGNPSPKEVVECMKEVYELNPSQKIYNISIQERQEQVLLHAWFMGEARAKSGNHDLSPILDGIATIDYSENILQEDCSSLPREVIQKLTFKKSYHHCDICGYLFQDTWDLHNLLGEVSEQLNHIVYAFFDISSAPCNYCTEKINLDKEVNQLKNLFC